MKVNFNWVELEGFRSAVKPIHFNLNRPGLNLIKGINGAGKTTMFEGIVWTLYGINLKDTSIGQVASWTEIRTSKWQGTRGVVCFDTEFQTYYIYRHLGYKGLTHDVKGEDYLMILEGDDEHGHEPKMIGDFRNKAEMQQEINRILGMDAKTFMNSILFGQRIAKLVEADNTDKRKLFETLFETEWVSDAKSKCDLDISKFESEMSNIDTNIRLSQGKIESLNAQLLQRRQLVDSFEENRANRILTKQSELDQYTIELSQNDRSIIQYNKEIKALKYDSARHDQLDADFKEVEESIHQREFDEIKSVGLRREYETKVKTCKTIFDASENYFNRLKEKHIESNCPYCEQELKAGNKLEVNHNKELKTAEEDLKGKKKALKEAETALKVLPDPQENVATTLDERLEVINSELNILDGLYQKQQELLTKLEKCKIVETQAKKDILRVNNEIEAIEAEKPPQANHSIEMNITTELTKLEALNQEKPVVQHKIDIAKWWSSKGFSSGGIKAYIFTSMLSQLNQNVKKYGQRLGVSLEFSIDLTKASKPFTTICSIGNKLNKDYNEFSGGEKQRLDICIMFAMFDLVSMGSDMNILIMDEALENLDEAGEAAAFDIIRSIAETGKSVYLISHSATIDTVYSTTIQFEKDSNGNTLIIN